MTPIGEAASVASLGAVVSTHRIEGVSRGRFVLRLGAQGVLLLVVARLVAGMLFPDERFLARWLVVVVVVAGLGAYSYLRRARGMTLVLHERGLSVHRGNETLVLPFRSLDSLTFIPRGQTESALVDGISCSYELRTGEELVVLPDDLEGLRPLAARIEQAIEEQRFAEMCAAFDAGEEVRFGDARVTKAGVQVDERVVPFGEIVEVRRDALTVTLFGGDGKRKLELDLHAVPNPGLFAALVRRALAGRA